MSMTTFTCIKPACSKTYESNEEEAYYCPSCVVTNKALADRINAQVASRPRKPVVSAVKEYENSKKISVGGMQGVHVKI